MRLRVAGLELCLLILRIARDGLTYEFVLVTVRGGRVMYVMSRIVDWIWVYSVGRADCFHALVGGWIKDC